MIINKNNLNVWKVSSGDTLRENINGIFFDKDGTVATDGHMLIKVGYPEIDDGLYPVIKDMAKDKKGQEVKPFLIARKEAQELQRSLGKFKDNLLIDQTAKLDLTRTNKNGDAVFGIVSAEGSKVTSIKKVDSDFPNYLKAMPKKKPFYKMGVDPALLIDMLTQFKEMGIRGVSLHFVSSDAPILFKGKTDGGQSAVGLLMPLNMIDEDEKQKPKKARPPEKTKEVKAKKEPKTLKTVVVINKRHKTKLVISTKTIEDMDKVVKDIEAGKAGPGVKAWATKIKRVLCPVDGCKYCDALGRLKS
jgi:hypothetical protein